MGEVIALPPGMHASIRAFAEETGLARDTVATRVKAAGLTPSGKRGGHPVYRVRDLLKASYFVTDEGEFDPDKLKPFERHAHYKAESEKLRLQTERGELVPRIEVEQEMGRLGKLFVHCLETLPDIIERDCGVDPQTVAAVEKRLDVVRENLYLAIVEAEAVREGGPA